MVKDFINIIFSHIHIYLLKWFRHTITTYCKSTPSQNRLISHIHQDILSNTENIVKHWSRLINATNFFHRINTRDANTLPDLLQKVDHLNK